jgi:hypothetical protein
VLAVASVLHDLGLTSACEGSNRFEVEGANAARTFLAAAAPDMEPPRRQLVWDSIALHTIGSIAQHKEPEVALLNGGIVIEYAGVGKDALDKRIVAAILGRFPRRRMKEAFTTCLCNLVRERPASTYGTWVADGHRFVPDYDPPSAVDRLLNAPYPE